MNKIQAALTNFMRGRYGMDQLNKILTATAFILVIAGSITQIPVINLFALTLIGYTVFRTYSKNNAQRAAENRKFQQLLKTVRKNFFLNKLRIKEFRTNRHIQCPHCGVIIRTSKQRGRRRMTCPKCKTEFEKRILI